MKEDILEQMVEDWLVSQPGWFVKHNIRFRPSDDCEGYSAKHDSVNSDIDILALNGTSSTERVRVITCKSWQGGFDTRDWLRVIEGNAEYVERHVAEKFVPRERWKYFRELVSLKWAGAFLRCLEQETGQRDFTYYIAVTKLRGTSEDRACFEESVVVCDWFHQLGSTMRLKVLTLAEMIDDHTKRLRQKTTPVLESTDVGRFLQLMHAAGIGPGSNI